MLLKYFYDDHLAQASYLLGCPGGGVAIVIDPMRHIEPYLDAAQQHDLKIIGVVETHIHADYVSGAVEMAHRLNCPLYVSGMGQGDLAYDLPPHFDVQYLKEGDHFMVGDVRVDVLFTPGHTPEHLAYQVTDTGADRPIGVFSGDFLFAGDVGRPDLLETAVKIADTKERGAAQQYVNVQRFKTLPDYLQIWPGHGAGSACGKALGAIPSTTLGYEKIMNPAFQQIDEASFIEWLLEGQPETPYYFAQMKAVNRVGAALLDSLPAPKQMDVADLPYLLDEKALVIDARPSQQYADGHVMGTLNLPGTSKSFSTWAGWYVDYQKPTYLIADEAEQPRLLTALRAVGIDHIPGVFTPDVVENADAVIRQLDVQEVAQRLKESNVYLLDVRASREREEEYIANSKFIPMGYVPERIAEIPKDRPVIVHCGSGTRSQVVASLLEQHGFDVFNMRGGMNAWKRAGLPLER